SPLATPSRARPPAAAETFAKTRRAGNERIVPATPRSESFARGLRSESVRAPPPPNLPRPPQRQHIAPTHRHQHIPLVIPPVLERQNPVPRPRPARPHADHLRLDVHRIPNEQRRREADLLQAEIRHRRAERRLMDRDADDQPERKEAP